MQLPNKIWLIKTERENVLMISLPSQKSIYEFLDWCFSLQTQNRDVLKEFSPYHVYVRRAVNKVKKVLKLYFLILVSLAFTIGTYY